MRIFVTGATGVIGRRAIPLLVAQGHEVSAVGRSPEKRARLARMGATAVDVDLFDIASLRRAVDGHEVVINLATHIPPTTRMFLPGAWAENDRIRSVASANLVEAATSGRVERFIQESFALVYPDCGDRWIDEQTPIQPTRYNRSVADAEHAAASFTERGGTGIVLRFAAFYGPDSEQAHFYTSAVRKGWALIPGSPDSFFSSVSHDDAAAAAVAALGASAGIYNVVDDEPLTRRDYFDALADALGVPPPRLLPAWTAHLLGSLGDAFARSIRMSNGKLKAETGWTPRYPSAQEGWRAVVREIAEGMRPHKESLRKAS